MPKTSYLIEFQYDPNTEEKYWAHTAYPHDPRRAIWRSGDSWEEAEKLVIETITQMPEVEHITPPAPRRVTV